MNTEKRGVDDESLLRLAAAAIHEQREENDEEITLTSREIQQRWHAVVRQYHKERFRENFRVFVQRAAVTVALLFAAISGTMVTAMAVSPTIREIVLTDFGKYSTLNMLISGGQVEIPEDWQERYYPTYIPKGFNYKKTAIEPTISSLIYEDSEGMYLDFTIIIPDADTDIGIDTENTTKTAIQIKGQDAVLYEKKNRLISRVLINYEDCVIDIVGPVSSEEIIKIAESIATKK